MAVVWSDIVGGTHGAALAAADWDPDAAGIILTGTGGTLTVRTSGGTFGSTKHTDEIALANSGVAYSYDTVTATDAYSIAREFVLVTAPSAEIPILFAGAGTTRNIMVALVVVSGTTRLRVRDAANTAIWDGSGTSSTTPVATGTRYLVSLYSVRSATVGTYRVVLYNLDTSAIVIDSTLRTGQNTGAAATTQVRRGPKMSTGAQTITLEGAGFGFDGAATGPILPRSTDDPPALDVDQPIPSVINLTGSTIGDDSTALTYATPSLQSGPALTFHTVVPGIFAFEQDTGDADSVYRFRVTQDDTQFDEADATIVAQPFNGINITSPRRALNTPPDNVWSTNGDDVFDDEFGDGF